MGEPVIRNSVVMLCGLSVACAAQHDRRVDVTPFTVVLPSEAQWGPLNPARGDQSPQAADLWGNRRGSGPTGFLVQFADGFESPPHIHNVSYRAVVIRGRVHNDDPRAEPMWMSSGSFWTQPRGAVHITAAQGEGNLIYVEIDEGPYLVKPTGAAFDGDEAPLNVDPRNLVWLAASSAWFDSSAEPDAANSPAIAFLWGDPRAGALFGSFFRVPAGMTVNVISQGREFRAVVVSGELEESVGRQPIGAASLLSTTGGGGRALTCVAKKSCVLYARTNGPYRVVPIELQKGARSLWSE